MLLRNKKNKKNHTQAHKGSDLMQIICVCMCEREYEEHLISILDGAQPDGTVFAWRGGQSRGGWGGVMSGPMQPSVCQTQIGQNGMLGSTKETMTCKDRKNKPDTSLRILKNDNCSGKRGKSFLLR